MAEGKNPVGHPPVPFDDVVAEAILVLIREGMALRKIIDEGSGLLQDAEGRDIMMPTRRVFFRWLWENEKYREQYALAKEDAADSKLEELDEIAEDAIKAAETADPRASNAVVQAHKLKADNLKWYMSKIKPKKYGEKLDLTSKGERLKQPPVIVSHIKPRLTDAGTQAETTPSS